MRITIDRKAGSFPRNGYGLYYMAGKIPSGGFGYYMWSMGPDGDNDEGRNQEEGEDDILSEGSYPEDDLQ